MALNETTYENFFLGNAAEHWIASQLCFHGFEACKYSPDFGIDLVVTNAAQARFKGDVLWTNFIQIKSTFLVKSAAKIYVEEKELAYLASTPNLATVFCFFSPHIEGKPQSFDRGDFEPWRESLEAQIDQHLYDDHFHRRKREVGCLSSFDFKGFDLDYFWMNAIQLKKSMEEGFWSNELINGTHHKVLQVEKSGDDLYLHSSTGRFQLIREIRSMYYLYKTNDSMLKIEQGAFSLSHY